VKSDQTAAPYRANEPFQHKLDAQLEAHHGQVDIIDKHLDKGMVRGGDAVGGKLQDLGAVLA
jgi:hypothetical protein